MIQYRGEMPKVTPEKGGGKSYVIITTEFKDVDRGMTFSSLATQVAEESGLDVVVFTGPDQSSAVKEFLKAESAEEPVRIHVSQHGVLCAYTRKGDSQGGGSTKDIQLQSLQIKYDTKAFDWPK